MHHVLTADLAGSPPNVFSKATLHRLAPDSIFRTRRVSSTLSSECGFTKSGELPVRQMQENHSCLAVVEDSLRPMRAPFPQVPHGLSGPVSEIVEDGGR